MQHLLCTIFLRSTVESVIWPPAIWLMPAWFKVYIQQTGMCKWNTAFYCQPTVLFVTLLITEKQDWFIVGFIWHDDWNVLLKCLTNWTSGVWLWEGMHSLHCCVQTGSRTSSLFSSEYFRLFSCMKLITYLNIVLRLRVSVIWNIPVFGMTPHSETWTSCSLNSSCPIPTLYIYTDYKLAGCCYVKLFQLKISGRKCLPVITCTSSAVFVSLWHISCAVTCGVTQLSDRQWSTVATRWQGPDQCCQLCTLE